VPNILRPGLGAEVPVERINRPCRVGLNTIVRFVYTVLALNWDAVKSIPVADVLLGLRVSVTSNLNSIPLRASEITGRTSYRRDLSASILLDS
jgi:hypothetical protein